MARSSGGSGKTGSDELARVIRDRREQLGMSRQDLADATGIPYPTVAQIETAYRGVSPNRLGVIARVLGLDPKELYDLLAADPAEPAGPQPRPAAGRAAGPWHANPRWAAAPTTSASPEIVEQVVHLLSRLPAGERIEALGQVQTKLLSGIVEEHLRRP